MSSTLVWRPIVVPKSNYLDDQLKFILRHHYSLPYKFSCDDLGFLRGLRAASVKGAKDLIEAIEKHESVEVKEEY